MRAVSVSALAGALLACVGSDNAALSASAGEQPAFLDGPITASDMAWLFDAACLVNHPDFIDADAVLDGAGFPDHETAAIRQHPTKQLGVVVMPLAAAADTQGARSCTVMAGGVPLAAVEAELAPLIASRLTGAERHEDSTIDVPHGVWRLRAVGLQTKVILVESDGATVVAASVAPWKAQQP